MPNLHRQIRWETASNGGGNYHSCPKGLGCKPDDPKTHFDPSLSITAQIQHYTGLRGHDKLADVVTQILNKKIEEERRNRRNFLRRERRLRQRELLEDVAREETSSYECREAYVGYRRIGFY